jgi:hypothetical protein
MDILSPPSVERCGIAGVLAWHRHIAPRPFIKRLLHVPPNIPRCLPQSFRILEATGGTQAQMAR